MSIWHLPLEFDSLTWKKGLRPAGYDNKAIFSLFGLILWPERMDYDQYPIQIDYFVVRVFDSLTWKKGLRPLAISLAKGITNLPVWFFDLKEGITTHEWWEKYSFRLLRLILWPERRDYDARMIPSLNGIASGFDSFTWKKGLRPVIGVDERLSDAIVWFFDLKEGITTAILACSLAISLSKFDSLTWKKGLRQYRVFRENSEDQGLFDSLTWKKGLRLSQVEDFSGRHWCRVWFFDLKEWITTPDTPLPVPIEF